ncbi:MAG: cellulase family glycosylhydrolase [Nitriliruptorales bacterium]|nr:cellulase family glycosylhydrolase [Nitriliruptorales bacterium]
MRSSAAVTTPNVRIVGRRFVDGHGRTLSLRGVNAGGSSKVPTRPDGRTHVTHGFYDHRDVSFVGRPFPLDETDEHFARLARWGLTFVRLLTTWEAVEHDGPGHYDHDYLGYLRAVVESAATHGINVFIDPHQDVWSRWTGGDGAPGWSLDAVGIDLTGLAATGAAVSHQTTGEPFPRMIWPTNHTKLGAATMFTLFFAGNDLLPSTTIAGDGAQDILQESYIAAMTEVARTVADLPNVVGYDTMNEPGCGWIDVEDLGEHAGRLRIGPSPTPLQSMVAASGRPVEVGVYDLLADQPHATTVLNPDGVRLWREGFQCPWLAEGVWEEEGPDGVRLLRPHHCAGRRFYDRYLVPFVRRYAERIRSVHAEAAIFVEGVPGAAPPALQGPADPDRIVHAGHWYDGLTLLTKHYDPGLAVDDRTHELVTGEDAVRRSVRAQMARLVSESEELLGGVPTLVGEIGVPFDLDDGVAYQSGDFSAQTAALRAYIDALDANLLSFTLWNYTADNTNEHGDGWNGEDLSIFSRDQGWFGEGPDSGARALLGFCRPYPLATAGTPLALEFDAEARVLRYLFTAAADVAAPTEIYVPAVQYPDGFDVATSAGTWRVAGARVLLDTTGRSGEVTVTVKPR